MPESVGKLSDKNNVPEVLPTQDDNAANQGAVAAPKICDLPRRTFFIILIIVVARAIIGVAVGVGVCVGVTEKESLNTNSTASNSTTSCTVSCRTCITSCGFQLYGYEWG